MKESKIVKYLLIILILFFVVEVAFLIIYHNTWYDEANYLYNSWATYEFNWVPYQDVWTRVPPVFYYIYGLPQYLFGPSLYVGRITSAVIFALALVLLYQIAKKLGGKTAGLISLAFMLLTPYLLRFYLSGTTYSLAILFVLASFWSLFYVKPKYQVVFSLMFASLAVLVRQTLAPLLIFLFIYWLIVSKDKKTKILSIIVPLFTFSVVLLPFFLIDSKNFIKDIFWFIQGNAEDMPLAFHRDYSVWGLLYFMIRKIIDVISEYASIFLLFFLSVAGLLIKETREKIKGLFSRKELYIIYLFIINFIVLFAIHYLTPNPLKFVIYSLYFMPLAILSFSVLLGKILGNVTPLVKKIIISSVIILLTLNILTVNYKDLYTFFPNRPLVSQTDLGKINRAAKIINKYLKKGDYVFTLDEPHLPLAAGLRIPPALSTKFEFFKTTKLEPEDNNRYWNLATAKEWFKEFDGAILQKDRWQAWFEIYELDEAIITIEDLIEQHCTLVEEIPHSYPEKYYLDPEGTALVYVCNRN